MDTVLKVLRDTKLNDGTLIRLSIVPSGDVEISTILGDGSRSVIRFPYNTEAAFEVLQMGHKLLHNCIQKELGKVEALPKKHIELTSGEYTDIVLRLPKPTIEDVVRHERYNVKICDTSNIREKVGVVEGIELSFEAIVPNGDIVPEWQPVVPVLIVPKKKRFL